MTCKTDISVAILLDEQSPDLTNYVQTLNQLFERREVAFELVIIANGTERFLKSHLDQLLRTCPNIKAFAFPRKVSQAVCVRAALKESCAEILVMCGSYQQITAEGLGVLLDAFKDDVDMVCPWRQQRVDSSFSQFQSRLFNTLLAFITGSQVHDLSCTMRILRREVLEKIRVYGNLYRFLPIMAKQKGYRIREIPCAHYQERGKTGFYGITEYIGRLVDIGTVYFNLRFSRKPLRFFSIIGSGLTAAGGLIALWVFFQKLFLEVPVGSSSELLTAIILMVAGVETAGLGLLGEIIAFTHGRQVKEYTIEKSF